MFLGLVSKTLPSTILPSIIFPSMTFPMERGVLGPISSLVVSQDEQLLMESVPKLNFGLQAAQFIPVPIFAMPEEQSQSPLTLMVLQPDIPIKGRANRIQLIPLRFTMNLLVTNDAILAGDGGRTRGYFAQSAFLRDCRFHKVARSKGLGKLGLRDPYHRRCRFSLPTEERTIGRLFG